MVSLRKNTDLPSYTPEHIAAEAMVIPSYTPNHILEEKDTMNTNVNLSDTKRKQETKGILEKGKNEGNDVTDFIAINKLQSLLEKADLSIIFKLFEGVHIRTLEDRLRIKVKPDGVTLEQIGSVNFSYKSDSCDSFLEIFKVLCREDSTVKNLFDCCTTELVFSHEQKGVKWFYSLRSLCAKLMDGNLSLDNNDFVVFTGDINSKWISDFYYFVYPRLFNIILRSYLKGDLPMTNKQWLQLCSFAELMDKGKPPKNVCYPIYFYKLLRDSGNIEKINIVKFPIVLFILYYMLGIGGIVWFSLVANSILGVLIAIVCMISGFILMIISIKEYKKKKSQDMYEIGIAMLKVCRDESFETVMKGIY